MYHFYTVVPHFFSAAKASLHCSLKKEFLLSGVLASDKEALKTQHVYRFS